MKDKILEIFKNMGSKHFSKGIKSDTKIWNWVLNNTKNITHTISMSERIYLSINNIEIICPISNKLKKFLTFEKGYGFCGKTGICACAKKSVSENVSKSKQEYSEETKKEINKKRDDTTFKLYGVTNNGQTTVAREKHKEFYKNEDNVKIAVKKCENTMMERYNVNNGFKLPKATYIRNNISQTKKADISKKAQITRKINFDPSKYWNINYIKIKNNLNNNFNIELLLDKNDYCGVTTRPTWNFKCNKCAYKWEQRFDYSNFPKCKICNPVNTIYISQEEISLLEYIKSIYSGSIISGDNDIIKPFEVDIYLPEKKLAIEYNGLYWHSEIGGGKKIWLS